MSSLEGVARNIAEADAALPVTGMTMAAEHIAAAYSSLTGVGSEQLSDVLRAVDGACGSVARAAQRCSVGRSALQNYVTAMGVAVPENAGTVLHDTAAEGANTPLGAAQVDSIFAQVIAQTVTNEGDISNRSINTLLVQASQLGKQVIEALHDPNQSDSMLQAIGRLQALQHEPYANDHTKKIVRQALSWLLYSDGGAGLRNAIINGQPEITDKALEILGATYGIHPNHDAQTTTLLAERFGVLCDAHMRAPPATPGHDAQREKLVDTYARLLADTSPEELTRLVSDSNVARAGKSENARLHRSLYSSAMRHLAHNNELRAKLFRRAGLDISATTKDWAAGNSHIVGSDQYFVDNIENVIQLEARQAGACQQLAARLGVYNFSRYPLEVLHEAHQALDNPPSEYIVFISAKSDHNGALDVRRQLGTLHDEIQKLNPGCKIIPVEIDTVTDAVKLQHRLRRRGWKQASHLLANGHSSENAMHLGTERFSVNPAADDKNRWKHVKALLRSVVAPGGTITVIGCSSGKGEDSLAQHIANGARRKTLAPGQDITLKALHAEPDPLTGKPIPVVTFGIIHSDETSPTRIFEPA